MRVLVIGFGGMAEIVNNGLGIHLQGDDAGSMHLASGETIQISASKRIAFRAAWKLKEVFGSNPEHLQAFGSSAVYP